MNEDQIARVNAAMAVLHAGLMTCQEAADMFAVDRAALWRRCARAGFRPTEQRASRLRALALKAIRHRWKLPTSMQPAAIEKKSRLKPQRNAHKRTLLAQLRSKATTVERAAKTAGVPISGIIGWMKLARIPIPEPYNTPRRKKDALKSDATTNT